MLGGLSLLPVKLKATAKTYNENSAVNISGNDSLYADWSELTVTGLKLISKPTKTEYNISVLDTDDSPCGAIRRVFYTNR